MSAVDTELDETAGLLTRSGHVEVARRRRLGWLPADDDEPAVAAAGAARFDAASVHHTLKNEPISAWKSSGKESSGISLNVVIPSTTEVAESIWAAVNPK